MILGVFQGLTEFLPISSSAHLILIPWMLGWVPMGILFDVVIHGGTLLAVLIYFWEDWKEVMGEFFTRIRQRQLVGGPNSLLDALVIATLPAIVVALIFKDPIEEYARTPMVTVVTLSLFGLLLLIADRRRGSKSVAQVDLRDALLVGMAQSLALIPGVSRSGITITAALFLGYSRAESARLSFLLAGPIIALGALDGALNLALGNGSEGLTAMGVVIGVVTSFVVGFACIKYLLQFLRTRSYLPFVLYRFLLSMVILWFVLRGV